ncbi:MAG TPA: ATP-binding protein [Micromonosporaceae bacterium]|nr:ATP-binding protein [Micromonosporaceae bacterium]
MGDAFDAERFFDEMAELIDHVNGGGSGLLALRHLVAMSVWMFDADSVAIVEFGPASGRIIAASGVADAVLGRRVNSGDELLRSIVADDEVVAGPMDELPADLVQLSPDSSTAIVGRILQGTATIGIVVVGLPYELTAVDALRLQMMRFVTSMASRLYRGSPGLPLHPDPTLRIRPETTAVLDRDGTVRWINPASQHVLEGTGVTVGATMPLPMPGPGQVLEHNLTDGRTLILMAKTWPDRSEVSLTVRDITESRRWEQSRELFVALTSHELRTPVTVIKGYAETLSGRWDMLDEAGRRDAARVLGLRAAELARLLDRLLTAVGEPGLPPVVERFDLGEAVTAAVGELPADLRARVRCRLPADLPIVFGEPASIASIVSELVTNAGKYAAREAGDIEVDGVRDARTVGIRVMDRGIGVRPEHVESAFERFWQADTGDHRRYSGVGLGLYLVRRIVERQNGWVSLRPRDAGGTVAEVRLPRGDLGRKSSRRPGEA